MKDTIQTFFGARQTNRVIASAEEVLALRSASSLLLSPGSVVLQGNPIYVSIRACSKPLHQLARVLLNVAD